MKYENFKIAKDLCTRIENIELFFKEKNTCKISLRLERESEIIMDISLPYETTLCLDATTEAYEIRLKNLHLELEKL